MKPLPTALAIVAINLVADAGVSRPGHAAERQAPVSGLLKSGSVETVYFAGRQTPVKVVRGTDPTAGIRMKVETRTFGDGTGNRVTILRGIIEPRPASGAPAVELAGLSPRGPASRSKPADLTGPGMPVLGGSGLRGSSPTDLFGLSKEEGFNRIADAVHGVESRYGTDARMWRLEDLNGPQGPMQVSAAAAFDVGGGNRFDISENMLLGRAYLARLFWRYNSWPDALAAYNWGRGNVDQWIARGRNTARLPAETARYVALVLRRALGESYNRNGPAARIEASIARRLTSSPGQIAVIGADRRE